jgi:hypothetical protein
MKGPIYQSRKGGIYLSTVAILSSLVIARNGILTETAGTDKT